MADGDLATLEPEAQAPVEHLPQSYDDLELTFEQRLILDPTIDLDRVNAVRAMRREEEAEAARKAFIQAKIKVQSEVPVIIRNQKNKHTDSKYADLAAIDAVLTPILKKHGFTTDASAAQSAKDGCIDVTFTTSHEAGHSEPFTLPWPIDTHGTGGKQNKTGVQGIKSTLTFARRAMKLMAFDIADKDEDGNAPQPLSEESLTDAQVKEIRGMLTKLDRKEEAFLQFMASKNVTVASELESVPIESFKHMQATLAGLAKKAGDENVQ